MDHFQHPRNVGEIENASGVGTVGNAKCGDIMRIYLDIDENEIIRDVKFKTFRLRRGSCYQQHGNRACKGKDYPGSDAGNQQSGYGSAGRTSAGKGTLFPACRGSDPCGALGLCGEAWTSRSRGWRNRSQIFSEDEEEEEEEY